MKTIRYVAAFLFLLTGILHILPMFKPQINSDAITVLIFGIIYLSIGVILLMKMKFGPILGIIFPLIGLAAGFLKIGIKNWDTMLSIMFVIDAVVIVCCVILLGRKRKT